MWKFHYWYYQHWSFQNWYLLSGMANQKAPKPSELVDRDREWTALTELWNSNRPELAFVLGRRRVGKSFLLSRFTRDVGGFYYQATGGPRPNSSRR
jgi:hypothetical protein